MVRDTMIRIAPLMLALCLQACSQAPEETSAPQALVAETPQGKTYDNPFGGNAGDASDNMTAVDGGTDATEPTTTDPIGTPAESDPIGEPEAEAATTPADTAPRMSRATGSCNDGKRVCGDMTSCKEAMYHLQQCGMRRLDGDSDGTPCEKIC